MSEVEYLCPNCEVELQNSFIMCDTGKCLQCSKETAYSVYKYCYACSQKLEQCYLCGKHKKDTENKKI